MDDSYKKLSDEAYALHIGGKLEEAEKIYKNLLQINPNDLNVAFLFAQLNVALRKYDSALEIYNKIYAKVQLEDIKFSIAQIYFYKNNFEETINIINSFSNKSQAMLKLAALSCIKQQNYKKALEYYMQTDKNSADFSILYNMSVCYYNLNDFESSLKYALLAFDFAPEDIDINLQIASIYSKLENENEELKYLLNINQKVNNVDIIYKIGCIYKHKEDFDKALEYFTKVISIDKQYKNAYINISILYCKINKQKAAEFLKELLKIFPNDTDVLTNTYFVYADMLDFDNCYIIAKKIMENAPDNVLGYSLYTNACMELYKYDEAEEICKKTLELSPGDTTALCMLAGLYDLKGKTKEAMEMLLPYLDDSEVMHAYNVLLLCNKKFAQAKENFYITNSSIELPDEGDKKARSFFYHLKIDKQYNISEEVFASLKNNKNSNKLEKQKEFAKKAWKDQDIKDKRLLIYSKNGIGDFIMFMRYLENVKKITKNIIIRSPQSCYDLMKYNYQDIRIISEKEEISSDEYDYTTTAFLLPYNINADFNNIPFSGGYLKIAEELISEKSKLEILKTSKQKAGLFWQGNPTILKNRSIKLKRLVKLFGIKDIQLFSFQISNIDFESEEYKSSTNLIDLAPYIKNYSDTAALLKNMDFLITIDSSIAHLAGAMGIKTYLLLPYSPEWRWFHDTKTTPWYDSIKIFKQIKPDDWEETVERLIHELDV